MGSASDDPVRQRSARISANSFLRRAKSLFASSVTKHLDKVSFPNPLPFDGVEFYKRASMRYQGSFDVFDLIEAAKKELAQPAPEQFKVFLLAVIAGLRRREIDTLEWNAFRWERGTIRIEPTKWFHSSLGKELIGAPAGLNNFGERLDCWKQAWDFRKTSG